MSRPMRLGVGESHRLLIRGNKGPEKTSCARGNFQGKKSPQRVVGTVRQLLHTVHRERESLHASDREGGKGRRNHTWADSSAEAFF